MSQNTITHTHTCTHTHTSKCMISFTMKKDFIPKSTDTLCLIALLKAIN